MSPAIARHFAGQEARASVMRKSCRSSALGKTGLFRLPRVRATWRAPGYLAFSCRGAVSLPPLLPPLVGYYHHANAHRDFRPPFFQVAAAPNRSRNGAGFRFLYLSGGRARRGVPIYSTLSCRGAISNGPDLFLRRKRQMCKRTAELWPQPCFLCFLNLVRRLR